MSKKRSAQLREYATRRERYLADHPVCEVWIREHGLQWVEAGFYDTGDPWKRYDADHLFTICKAPRATEIHHTNKRRGEMLNDETHWLAVCRKNHERIENDKAWARREGFLLNF